MDNHVHLCYDVGMTHTVIHIDIDQLDERLDHGKRWTTGWGDYESATGYTCLHGAIRHCQPIPGDAYLIEHVGPLFGFGISDNDKFSSWDQVKAHVVQDITDLMLEETFGPQWAQIVALVRRAAILTAEDAEKLVAARVAARDAARNAAGVAARNAAGVAARALVAVDLIGDRFTQTHYDLLTRPWATAIGPVHPDDTPAN